MTASGPILFAIKRYALHDGPHIRITVFFKGCPMSCFWCHNPEGISAAIEIVTDSGKCIGCSSCLDSCPESALVLTGQGVIRDRGRCTGCLRCVEICPALAHETIGRRWRIDEILTEIDKESPFFDVSGGGVTFSGGEPLLQPDALVELLRACGRLGIHRAVDTTGFAPTETLLSVARHTDLFLFDLKHMDSSLHHRYTGVPNELILHNLTALSRIGVSIRVRVPLLAGINDDRQNINACATFISSLDAVEGVDILPYHDLAGRKYRKLDRQSGASGNLRPTIQQIEEASDIFKSFGHHVRLGG